jgi:hypothetical protein
MAFANIYRDFVSGIVLRCLGDDPSPALAMLPMINDGLSTMRVIDAACRSHEHGSTVFLD